MLVWNMLVTAMERSKITLRPEIRIASHAAFLFQGLRDRFPPNSKQRIRAFDLRAQALAQDRQAVFHNCPSRSQKSEKRQNHIQSIRDLCRSLGGYHAFAVFFIGAAVATGRLGRQIS